MFNFMRNKKVITLLFSLICLFIFSLPNFCKAMPPGTLLYRTTDDGKMFGYTKDSLIEIKSGVIKGINPGHVGIYIGQEAGVDYVVEALAGGIVKTKLEHFVNESLGERFLGAKIPEKLSPLQQAKVVNLAKNMANSSLAYDFDFKKQKGPKSGQWTCVGLAEKVYESANIANPLNLDLLEYDPEKYAINITPDGFDNYSLFNNEGDCFSLDKEFSLVAPRTNIILPLSEKYGFNSGLIYKGERYIFFPYTQYLQKTLKDVVVDKKISSSFDSTEIRGGFKSSALVLRWSLINNPVSAVKIAWDNLKEKSTSLISGLKTAAALASDKLFSGNKKESLIVDNKKNDNFNSQGGEDLKSSFLSIGEVKVAEKKVSNKEEKTSLSNNTKIEGKNKNNITSLIVANSNAEADKKNEEDVKKNDNSEQFFSFETKTKEEFKTNNNSSIKNSLPATSSIVSKNEVIKEDKAEVIKNDRAIESIKISKIYSTLNDDFIELYNPNNFSVDLLESSYRLEKAKTGIDPSIMIRIGNLADGSYPGGTTIPANGYYLIVKDSASSYYLDKADAIASRGDFSLTGLNQTVYLGVGAISSYYDEDIVDVVGFGPGAKYYLGSGPAPKIEDYHFLNRVAYKNNNRLDYNLLLSAEPAAVSAWQLQNSQESQLTGDSNNPVVPVVEVNKDDESDEDKEGESGEGDNEVVEEPVLVNGPSEEEIEKAIKKVLIKKIGVFGNDDYIEIFNYSEIDLDLAEHNFRLEKSKTTLAPLIMLRIGNLNDASYPGGTIIPANSSYLIVRDSANERFLNIADAIVTRKDFNLFSSGYSIYLGRGPISSPDDKDIIDLLGYGPDSLYYLGSAPALAIKDGFFLERFSFSNNNYSDFALIRDEYYEIEEEDEVEEGEVNDLAFVFPDTQTSANLKYLWNFDDCYEELGGEAVVGKWSCGRKFGYLPGNFTTDLDEELDLSSFSVGFYYKPDYYWPRIDLKMEKVSGGQVVIGVESGYLLVEGLPASGYFYLDTDFEDQWNYLTLVINQSEGYWSVFSNGKQLMKKHFLAKLPMIKNLSLEGGGGSMYFEELAIWDRALSKEEIKEIIEKDIPFYPTEVRTKQEVPKLLHHWKFEEYGEEFVYDSIANQEMTLNSVYWGGRDNDNYAIAVDNNRYAELDFDQNFASQDLSFSFWYKNISHPDDGRINLELLEKRGEEEYKKFGLAVDNYRQNYLFNNKIGVISDGFDKAIPNDGKWHHLALVYDSYRYRLRFFVDTKEFAQISLIRMKDGNELINSLRIYSDSRSAAIDDLMIFTGSLRPIEIRYIYQTTKHEEWPYEDFWGL